MDRLIRKRQFESLADIRAHRQLLAFNRGYHERMIELILDVCRQRRSQYPGAFRLP